jgi:basic membrane protein A and related proteins
MKGGALECGEGRGLRLCGRAGLKLITLAAIVLAGCASRPGDCASPDVWCAGLVTDFGNVTQGINNQAWLALEDAKADGLLAKVDRIETVDSRDRAANIAAFGDAGYDIVVTVGASISEETSAAARRYPGTAFIGVEQAQQTEIPNLAGLVFHEEQSGFLAGVLADSVTQTGHVAAVCEASFIDAMRRYCEGFRAGALYGDPKVRVTVSYRQGRTELLFHDADWGRESALEMLDAGADVVFSAGGETADAALQAAAGSGALIIGAETDTYTRLKDVRPQLLTSAVSDVRAGVGVLVVAARQGKLPPGDTFGQVGLAPFHDLERRVPAETEGRLAKIRAMLETGEILLEVPYWLP